MKERILLSAPHMNGHEMKYIDKAFETNWVAPLGENVNEFENSMAKYIGVKSGVALCSGTAAIHLGLKYLGVSQGDTVFCSDVTFSASCNPIAYEHAEPVFIDSDNESFNMSPKALEKAFDAAKKRAKLPKAVVIVDLYGLPADYNALLPICEHYGVPVLEDAAEALGSTLHDKKCGAFGDISALSFNGNKIITTSGGGMALVKSEECAEKLRFWATQSRDKAPHYQHSEIGYNYRLSNISAGIGRGQIETLEEYIEKRRSVNAYYRDALKNCPLSFTPVIEGADPNYWLSVIILSDDCKKSYLDVMSTMESENIETRPFWKPMHMQPVFGGCEFYSENEKKPVGEDLFSRGLCLPSGISLTDEMLERVTDTVKKVLL